MRRVALRGLLARRVRAFLTAFAIVLGVAMVSGTYILTDTIQKAFTNVFTSSYRNTSVIVMPTIRREWKERPAITSGSVMMFSL